MSGHPRCAAVAALSIVVALTAGCAGNECNFNSQCGRREYCSAGSCHRDCSSNIDCAGGLVCSEIGQCVTPGEDSGVDTGTPPRDSGVDSSRPPADTGTPPRDTGTPPADTGTPPRDTGTPPMDTGTPPMDTGTPLGTGQYFDRCSVDTDCATGVCVNDVGGARLCTRSCTTHRDCAHGYVCAGSRCVHDDTGTGCSVSAPASCALGLCLGPAGGAGSCTRDCTQALDCPAGYACTRLSAGGPKVCVDIEKPCTTGGTECATGLCLSAQGCTATCDSAADCPGRLTSIGLPAYECRVAFGSSSPICVPPSDVLGADPIGASCPASGSNTCRSDACDTGAPSGPVCTQACNPIGGCGPGFGCFPLGDATGVALACVQAGRGALGAPCANARDCDSAICDPTSHLCSRICEDGMCPTGATCRRDPIPGAPALCLGP